METSLIEKYDKLRYNLILWFTIGWAIWFGSFILKDVIDNKIILSTILVIGFLGSIVYAVNLIRINRLSKIINADIKLKSALNDELIISNRKKSFVLGYSVLMLLIGVFYGLSLFFNIKALLICQILVYVGVLSALVSSLIYNRSGYGELGVAKPN